MNELPGRDFYFRVFRPFADAGRRARRCVYFPDPRLFFCIDDDYSLAILKILDSRSDSATEKWKQDASGFLDCVANARLRVKLSWRTLIKWPELVVWREYIAYGCSQASQLCQLRNDLNEFWVCFERWKIISYAVNMTFSKHYKLFKPYHA